MDQAPDIPSRVGRPPAPGTRTGPPSSLARSYKSLPTLDQWRIDTAEGRVAGRANDPVLRSIDHIITELEFATDGAELYLLGQLFFNTMSWLNHYKNDPVMVASSRKPILSLNLFASNNLARILECGVGDLAGHLQDLYGVEMSQHGIDTDIKESPRYFDAAKREIYRTFVVYGRLHHYRSGQGAFVILDTGASSTEGRPGYGFVLSMSNELYIGNFGAMSKTYHSTFMAGRPIQCAGTLQIENGCVIYIKNDSGHYKPVDQSLVKVLLFLQMHGLDTGRITVASAAHQKGEKEQETTGEVFMQENGNWDAIEARAQHQQPWLYG